MSGLLIGILALIGGTQRYLEEETLTREPGNGFGGGGAGIKDETPYMAPYVAPSIPGELDTVIPYKTPGVVIVGETETTITLAPEETGKERTETTRRTAKGAEYTLVTGPTTYSKEQIEIVEKYEAENQYEGTTRLLRTGEVYTEARP